MKILLLVAILTISVYSSAQTGPGGVGNNAGTSNLVLWLDANTETAGVNGSPLTLWHDRSGNFNDATSPTTAARPTFVSPSVNGYPSLDFDGANDEYRVVDNATIDLTQWHIFIVPIVDLAKNYNAWLVKGRDARENYELLSFVNNNMHGPVRYRNNSRSSMNAPGNQLSTTNFNVIEYSSSTAVGRDFYTNGTNVATDNERSTPRTNNFDLYIGDERGTSGRNINGDLAEVLIYNTPLNSVQRIIVNNYLSAKYGRPTASDIYRQDNPANGNYDHDVAGIGRVDASNQHNNSQGTGIVRILNPTNLGNNEFLMWGHDNGALSFTNNEVPVNISNRLAREWRVSEVNTSGSAIDVGNIDMSFDLTGMGTFVASELRLLIDTDNDGVFADEIPISGATSLGGNVYQFAGVSSIANNLRFTLALSCTNYTSTITLNSNTIAVCQSDDSAVFSFTGTTNNPDRYSIDFDSTAEAAGFADVIDATLLGSSFTVTVPSAVAAATYNASLTVRNANVNCPSLGYDIQIVVHPTPSPRLYFD